MGLGKWKLPGRLFLLGGGSGPLDPASPFGGSGGLTVLLGVGGATAVGGSIGCEEEKNRRWNGEVHRAADRAQGAEVDRSGWGEMGIETKRITMHGAGTGCGWVTFQPIQTEIDHEDGGMAFACQLSSEMAKIK